MYRGEVRFVKVHCEISEGVGIHMLGIPEDAVKDILLAVASALNKNGYHVPGKKIVLSIEGAGQQVFAGGAYRSLDLAVTVAILLASDQVRLKAKFAEDSIFYSAISVNGNCFAPVTCLDENAAAVVVDWFFRNTAHVIGFPCSQAVTDNYTGIDSLTELFVGETVAALDAQIRFSLETLAEVEDIIHRIENEPACSPLPYKKERLECAKKLLADVKGAIERLEARKKAKTDSTK